MTQSIHQKSTLLILLLAFVALAAVPVFAQDTGAAPERSSIDDKYKWRVEDMYETIADWEADYARLENGLPLFDQYRGHLAESPRMLLGCLQLDDSLNIIDGNLYVYAYLKLDEDTRKSEYQELGGRISGLDSRFSEAEAFLKPEILEMDETKLEALFAQEPKLRIYRAYLDDLMRTKAHILSAEEEALMALAGQAVNSPSRVFNMLENADHKYGTIVDADGNAVELTPGRYTRIMRSTDREQRRIANDTVQAGWHRYLNTMAATLGASLQRDLFFTKARKYNTCLERSLDGYNIPTSVFDNLLKAVNDNLDVLHRYTALRKKVLGFDTLQTYDMGVPLAPPPQSHYTYEECTETMLKALNPMGKTYVKDAGMGLGSGWIDVYETVGKTSGGYNWGTFTSHPYILLNFTGQLDDMFTLAHEMGHALHGWYTNHNEPYVYHGHSLFTAEVASTCNEALLMQYLLDNAKSKEEKIALLYQFINNIDGTFFTQVMFSEFELAIHEHIESGGATSADWFRETYRNIFQKYYGPELYVGPMNDMGGMKISHFYRQYYVYQYATSFCAAQMLSQKILEGDKKAIEQYNNFLKVGTSKYPVDILMDAGVDMNSPEPVERTLRKFGELVDELERLLNES